MTIIPVSDPIETKAVELWSKALPARILTAADYTTIAEDFKATVALIGEIAGHHDPIIASAHKTHKLACDAKRKLEEPLLRRKNAESRLLGDYQAEQRRLAAEEERKKREEALRVERERVRAEEAEARRIAAEKFAEAEKARNDALAASELAQEAFEAFDGVNAEALQNEATAGQDVAMRAEMEGQEAERLAMEIATAPVYAPAVRVEPDTPAVTGLSGRVTWSAEVVNKRRYLEHVLANWGRYENTVEIVMASLNRTAVSVKKEIEIEPGVMARPKNAAVARS